ncbi:MAG: DUF268 domain-containing protein [Bacteroidetes bacterium]|nr:DUF268 domain-containing protein [Bacteroidota bacterium]
MRKKLAKYTFFRILYSTSLAFKQYIKLRFGRLIKNSFWYFGDYRRLKKAGANPAFTLSNRFLQPCLIDKTETTPLEPTYFFQDSWAAGKIFSNKPDHHYDVGSAAKTVGIISQFVPTTMIDIRPIELSLPNLDFIKGSILEMPFDDNSLESLSSLCVVEHIGLGRYGDPIDPYGSEKAIMELIRVVKPGGNLYFSVPIDSKCIVYFNAHRAFTRDYVMKLFAQMKLIEEKYHYGKELIDKYVPEKGFGTGLYHFQKI